MPADVLLSVLDASDCHLVLAGRLLSGGVSGFVVAGLLLKQQFARGMQHDL